MDLSGGGAGRSLTPSIQHLHATGTSERADRSKSCTWSLVAPAASVAARTRRSRTARPSATSTAPGGTPSGRLGVKRRASPSARAASSASGRGFARAGRYERADEADEEADGADEEGDASSPSSPSRGETRTHARSWTNAETSFGSLDGSRARRSARWRVTHPCDAHRSSRTESSRPPGATGRPVSDEMGGGGSRRRERPGGFQRVPTPVRIIARFSTK